MKEALKLALEALNWSTPHEGAVITHGEAIAAIKAALAQPAQQKPVAWMDADGNVSDNNDHKCFPIPLYTITHPTPPQRTWVGLTDEEVKTLRYKIDVTAHWTYDKFHEAIEAKLKEKNT